MVTKVYQWLSVIINGCQWLPMVISCYQWLPMVIGYQWLPMVISDSHRLSAIVTGYQWLSMVTLTLGWLFGSTKTTHNQKTQTNLLQGIIQKWYIPPQLIYALKLNHSGKVSIKTYMFQTSGQ